MKLFFNHPPKKIPPKPQDSFCELILIGIALIDYFHHRSPLTASFIAGDVSRLITGRLISYLPASSVKRDLPVLQFLLPFLAKITCHEKFKSMPAALRNGIALGIALGLSYKQYQQDQKVWLFYAKMLLQVAMQYGLDAIFQSNHRQDNPRLTSSITA